MISDYDALTHVTWWRHTITDSAVLVSNTSTSTHIHFSLYLIHFESNKLTLFYAIHQTLSLNIPSKISHFFFERSYLLEEIQHQDCVLTSSLPRIYIFPFSKLTGSGVNWSNGGKLRLNPVILTRNSAIVIKHRTNHENKGRNIAAIPTTGFSRPRARMLTFSAPTTSLLTLPIIRQYCSQHGSPWHRRGFGLLTSAFINNHSTGDKWRETGVDMKIWRYICWIVRVWPLRYWEQSPIFDGQMPGCLFS